MPRKYELTFQRGADGRSGRWKKFYRGKAHYLGAGRSKSDIESYRTALEAWNKLKVQLDAELIPVPRAYDSKYDEVIREWEFVLAWSVQNGASDEAVVAREKLVELRARREKARQLPVTHHDRLWSRLRPAPEELQKIADIALARQGESLDAFREAIMKRSYVLTTTTKDASAHSINRVDPFQKAEIEWQDRLANQSKVIASDDTRSLGGWVQAFLAKEQQRVNAGELSASRFAAVRGTLFYFRDWAGAAMDASSISGQTLSRYHSHLLDLVGSNTCSSTYAKGRMVSLKTFIRWLWGQDVIESLPKNIDSRESSNTLLGVAIRLYDQYVPARWYSRTELEQIWSGETLVVMKQSAMSVAPDSATAGWQECCIAKGLLHESAVASFKFSLRNAGSQPLLIEGVQKRCGCIRHKVSAQRLAPQESAEIEVDVTLNGKEGYVQQYLIVKTNDPARRLS